MVNKVRKFLLLLILHQKEQLKKTAEATGNIISKKIADKIIGTVPIKDNTYTNKMLLKKDKLLMDLN